MKYFKRLNVYKNSTGSNKVDLSNRYAISYDWWEYLKIINGILVFNSFYYSPSTSKHQSDCLRLLREHGLEPALRIESPKGLQNLNSAIEHYECMIRELQQQIDKPRSRQAKNQDRQLKIVFYKHQIERVKCLQQWENAA